MPVTEPSGHFSLKAFSYSVLFFFLYTVSYCQTYPDQRIDSTLKYGINQIILQNYNEAGQIFSDLNLSYPQLPLGHIYLAALKIARSYDYGTDYEESTTDSLLSLAKKQSLKLLKSNDNLWNRYFLSLTEGYLAYFKALSGDWLNSLSEGVNALQDFGKLLEQDGNFYEAFIAIGTFKYWKSRKTEFLDWLPGYTDERAEGILLLEKAVSHQTYNTYLAINSLIWIYIDQKEYLKAERTALNALKLYPGSRFFKWGLARQRSIQVYREILNSLPDNSNHYYEIILKHLIAQQYVKINEFQKAAELCDEILSIKNLDKKTHSRLESRLERVSQLRRELSR